MTAVLFCLSAVAGAYADTTVFVNVNVLPMSSEIVLTQQSVVVVDGKIAQIGDVDTVPVPKGSAVVDGTDRFLMPGLAEMHAHVTSVDPDQIDRLSTLFIANGITTIRGMLGAADHLVLRDKFESGEVFGPHLITSGPSLNGRTVFGAADAARQVREQMAAGYDFVKVHPGLSLDEFLALANTANEIGMPYAGHVPAAAGVRQALQNNMATIDHLDGYFAALLPAQDSGSGGDTGFFDVMLADQLKVEEIAVIVAATKAAGTWNVPTEVLIEQLIDDTPVAELRLRPETRYVPAATVRDWVAQKEAQLDERDFDPDTATLAIELRRRLILELYRAGAGLLLGSDAPQTFNVPGFSVHRELKVLTLAGLTPFEALRTGTVEVARFLGSNGGSVAVGNDADLILLDANPLEDIRNSDRIHGVMLRGVWHPASELQDRLERYAVRNGD
ncbi:MAG: amidohydrolase family protein [Woeseiaceae bacterium]|nr:amidohydrolase family protein [Woeseiaceae bacterium]